MGNKNEDPEVRNARLKLLREASIREKTDLVTGQKRRKTTRRLDVLKIISDQLANKDETGETYLQIFLQQFFSQAMVVNSPSYALLASRLVTPDIMDKLDSFVNSRRNEDLDFMQYRVVKRTFDRQREYVTSWAPRSYVMAGRRAGKTEGNRLKCIVLSFKSNARILVIGLTFETCLKLYYDPLLDLADLYGLKVGEKRRIDGLIAFTNGAEIHFRGNSNADEREKLRGRKW